MTDKELQSFYLQFPDITRDTEHLFDAIPRYREIMMMYSCAAREIRTKLEVLNDDFSVRYNRNPIEIIKTRVKRPLSLYRKIQKRGLPMTEETLLNAIHEIHDIAGVRVICSFIDDIYEVARLLLGQDDITLIEIKDYIGNPKPNGYRSLHLIVQIPVFFSDRMQQMTVEVQIRTLAMDFWASLDRELHYKKDDIITNVDEVERELLECANIIFETDKRMQGIRVQIYGEEPTRMIVPQTHQQDQQDGSKQKPIKSS